MNLYYTWHLCSASTAPPDRVWRVYKHEDIQARDLKLAELVKQIDLRPWIDCACTTYVKNGEAYRDLLAMLETANGPY